MRGALLAEPVVEHAVSQTAIADRQRVLPELVEYRPHDARAREDDVGPLGLKADDLRLPTSIPVWPNANWYEREVWDLFGIEFTGHPHMVRILLPRTW